MNEPWKLPHICFFYSDNYGFVSFRHKVDAYAAVEHGNDDPSYSKVDLCFGGRRKFCKEKYSDLGTYIHLSNRLLYVNNTGLSFQTTSTVQRGLPR